MADTSINDIMTGKALMFDPEIGAAEKAAKEEQTRRVEFRRQFLVWLMENQDFRVWLMERLVEFGTFENCFGASPNGSPDPLATQFQAGMKAAGWSLWTTFDDAAPELASLMRRERSNPQS